MSAILPQMIAALKQNGIQEVAAVVNRLNTPASKVLLKAGFKCVNQFDYEKDLYSISA
jgi:predicted acetyltransferase